MRFKIFIIIFTLLSIHSYAEIGYVEPWGTDASLLGHTENRPPPHLSLLGRGSSQVILFHQNVLTKICGPRSHFRPSSSQYMLEAIAMHGFFKGYIMGCDRLLRENQDPWVYRKTTYNNMQYKSNPPPKK